MRCAVDQVHTHRGCDQKKNKTLNMDFAPSVSVDTGINGQLAAAVSDEERMRG